jgi:hypothetical protein
MYAVGRENSYNSTYDKMAIVTYIYLKQMISWLTVNLIIWNQ